MSILDEILDEILALFFGKAKTAVATSALTVVENAPLSMPIPRYDSLPQSPIAEPPAIQDPGELAPDFLPRAAMAKRDIDAALSAIGWTSVYLETYRDPVRQLWLWGIGRFYQAPGRTGIVTKVKVAGGKHPKRKAFDLGFKPIGGRITYPTPETVLSILRGLAPSLRSRYSIQWGGEWSTPDFPHYEDMIP